MPRPAADSDSEDDDTAFETLDSSLFEHLDNVKAISSQSTQIITVNFSSFIQMIDYRQH